MLNVILKFLYHLQIKSGPFGGCILYLLCCSKDMTNKSYLSVPLVLCDSESSRPDTRKNKKPLMKKNYGIGNLYRVSLEKGSTWTQVCSIYNARVFWTIT